MAITPNVPGTRFGIKEVADVHFFDITATSADSVAATLSAFENSGDAVISFDTLKVSTIESTAENSEARGGKGNAALISWDYGREITVNLEDALLSMETLSLLFENNPAGNDNVIINADTFPGTYAIIGTTYARNETDGKDHVFKFVIPKAKIQSETTLTMEADGDPTVIGMTLKVLRAKNGDMMGLVREGTPYTKTTAAQKVHVTLVATSGEMTTYYLTEGGTWPTGVSSTTYTDLPDKVTAGTYYAKSAS